MGTAPTSEVTEPFVVERVEPTEEATLLFRQTPTVETSAADKGKEKEIVVPIQKKKKHVPQ